MNLTDKRTNSLKAESFTYNQKKQTFHCEQSQGEFDLAPVKAPAAAPATSARGKSAP